MKKQQTDQGHARIAGRGLTTAWMALALVAISGVQMAHAQSNDAQAGGQPPASEIDHATHQWLALQRGNTEAAPAQPMLGDEASLAYKRYLESFNSKIPDFYTSSIGQGSSGSGSSNGGLGGASN